MKPPDKGLLLSSHVDFTIPSPFAREHLYYLIQYKRYQCVPGYEVKRDFLDMYLCAYVCAQRFATHLLRRTERERYRRTACTHGLPPSPPVLRHRADRVPLVSLFRRRKRGFNSTSHFSRVFRSREKMTPSKFHSMNF